MLSVVEEDKKLARVFGVANDQAFSRKRPVINKTNVRDFFAMICVEHFVEANLLAKKFHVAVFVGRKKRPEM